MHLIVGFAVFVALVAFAFGSEAARNTVRTVMVLAAIIVLTGLTYFAVDVWRELRVDSNGADAAQPVNCADYKGSYVKPRVCKDEDEANEKKERAQATARYAVANAAYEAERAREQAAWDAHRNECMEWLTDFPRAPLGCNDILIPIRQQAMHDAKDLCLKQKLPAGMKFDDCVSKEIDRSEALKRTGWLESRAARKASQR